MNTPPLAKQQPHTHVAHDDPRPDPYHWMRDDNRTNPEVIEHLEKENAYARTVMAPTTELQRELFNELKGRLKQDDSSVPVRRRNYFYYSRYAAGQEYPIYCRRRGSMSSDEEIVLNENDLSVGHDYYSLGAFSVGEDEQTIAYAEDTLSRRIYTIRFLNLATGKKLPDTLEGASTSMAWAADGKSFFYVDKDDKTLRPYAVRRHIIGTPQSEDVTVFEEKDEAFYVGVSKSKSRRFIFIHLESTEVSETLFVPAESPGQPFQPVLARKPKVEYDVHHHDETFYIRTNEGATNFKLISVPVKNPEMVSEHKTIIDGRSDAMLDDIEVFENYLVTEERIDGQRQVFVRPWATMKPQRIDFDEEVYTASSGDNPEFETDKLRLVYSSYVTPKTVIEYSMDSGEKKVLKQDQILGGFDPSNYKSTRLWIEARDGTKVPVSVVTPSGFKKDGDAPLYLYAYGSYGYAMDPWFSPSWISLLDRGFAVAVAHIRGGEEMGREWYNQGRLFNKINTFTDFIDCSEALIKLGYTRSDRLIAAGGSAGGLLMGAVANMRPDLYHVIHAAVPFVDVVTTMLDATIPLTTNEYDEWGNPNREADYRYMLSYSPYDQVRSQAYPHMIVTTGFHDSQVQYWEPMKWVAKLRAHKTDANLLLFDTEMETGHSGAAGRYKRYENTAMVFAFFMLALDDNLARWSLNSTQ